MGSAPASRTPIGAPPVGDLRPLFSARAAKPEKMRTAPAAIGRCAVASDGFRGSANQNLRDRQPFAQAGVSSKLLGARGAKTGNKTE